jgi:uncharacterized membrane protein
MTDHQIATLVFILVGMVFVGVGFPLFSGRVKPNLWYGCRTGRTLSDEGLWYRANRRFGAGMMVLGAAIAAAAALIYRFVPPQVHSARWIILMLAWLVSGTVAIAVSSARTR